MKARFWRIAPLPAALVSFCSAKAWADKIMLQNDVVVEGIIAETTQDSVEVQVDKDSFVYYPRKSIVRIKKGTEDENADLLEKWGGGEEGARKASEDFPGEVQGKAPGEGSEEEAEESDDSSGILAPCAYPGRSQVDWLTPEDCEDEKEDAEDAKEEAEEKKAAARQAIYQSLDTGQAEPSHLAPGSAINALPPQPGVTPPTRQAVPKSF